MFNILMLSGPALGHVARLTLVAEALLKRDEVVINFVVPDFCQHTSLPEKSGCHIRHVPIADADRKLPARSYADQIEQLFTELNPDIIVQDCNPLRWLPAVRFPDCPRIIITNAFLTDHAGTVTHQSLDFSKRKTDINILRSDRGLPELGSAFDLYKGTRTLLSDPVPVAERYGPWPVNTKNCGPLCLELNSELPEVLHGLSDIALFSMGSTGGLENYTELAGMMQKSSEVGQTVYVGSRASEALETGCFDHCFDWLPLSPLLEKASVTITHGGTGSTYLSLSKGVPVFVSPKHANHALLAECLSHLGVGALLDDISDLSRLQAMKTSLDQYGPSFDHRDAPDKHAEAILEFLPC